MMRITPLKSAQVAGTYFEKDDYFSKEKLRQTSAEQLVTSDWWGEGSKRLGLKGEVLPEVFKTALDGNLPDGRKLRNKGKHPGFDLTFNAPKSVSFKILVDGDVRLHEVHRKAVERALRYVEQTGGAQARVTQNGASTPVRTDNLVVAQFHHFSTRVNKGQPTESIDPQIHTHAVVLNSTQRADGKWRALHEKGMYTRDFQHAAGNVYKAELAQGLEALGYKVQIKKEAVEIAGYQKEQLEAFSKRSQQIKAHVKDRGEQMSPEAKQRAALYTRGSKQEVDAQQLKASWVKQAQELGIHQSVQPKAAPDKAQHHTKAFQEAQQLVTRALDHFAERRLSFSERELTRVAMDLGLGKVGPGAIEKAIQREQEEGGRLVAARERVPHVQQFVTQDALDLERKILGVQRRQRQRYEPIVKVETLEQELSNTTLTDGQKAAVLMSLSTRDGVAAVQGYAGTGKTYMLSEVRKRAEAQGFEVKGFGPSTAATQALQSDAQIKSETLQGHLMALQRARTEGDKLEPPKEASKQLWVLDESSMVSNKQMAAFLQAAERKSARVVLVGDVAQLPSVEAGAAFGLLQSRGIERADMKQIQRQKNPELLKAVHEVLDKQEKKALQTLKPRIVELPDEKARIEHAARGYLDAERRDRTLVITPANKDRVKINEVIREGLRQSRAIRGEDVQVPVLVPKGFTGAEIRESKSYEQGDVVRFQRAYKRSLQVQAGELWKVKSIDTELNQIELVHKDGRTIEWTPHSHAKVEVYREEQRKMAQGDKILWTRSDKEQGLINGKSAYVSEICSDKLVVEHADGHKQTLDPKTPLHLDHAYAVTVHRSQGQTVDKLVGYLPTDNKQLLGRESFYVSISRARHDVELVTDDKARLGQMIGQQMVERPALDAHKRQTEKLEQASPKLQRDAPSRDFGLELER